MLPPAGAIGLLLAGAAALSVDAGHHHHHHRQKCAHESTQRKTGGVRNLGYHYNRRVAYSEDERGRRLSGTSWAPIRISLQYTSTSAAVERESWLKDTLLPAAQDWLQRALLVSPVSGALKVSRGCNQFWNANDKCAEEAAFTCGVDVVDDVAIDYVVKENLLDELEVCTDGPTTGCSTSAAGAGAADADFILFVSSVAASACSGGTLAYASSCQRDGTGGDWHGKDRPSNNHAAGARTLWRDARLLPFA